MRKTADSTFLRGVGLFATLLVWVASAAGLSGFLLEDDARPATSESSEALLEATVESTSSPLESDPDTTVSAGYGTVRATPLAARPAYGESPAGLDDSVAAVFGPPTYRIAPSHSPPA